MRLRAVTGAGPLAVLTLSAAAMAGVALAFVWATYAFQPRLANDAEVERTFEWWRIEPETPSLAGAVRAARATRLFPDAYLYGRLRAPFQSRFRLSCAARSRIRAGGITFP